MSSSITFPSLSLYKEYQSMVGNVRRVCEVVVLVTAGFILTCWWLSGCRERRRWGRRGGCGELSCFTAAAQRDPLQKPRAEGGAPVTTSCDRRVETHAPESKRVRACRRSNMSLHLCGKQGKMRRTLTSLRLSAWKLIKTNLVIRYIQYELRTRL